MKIILFIFIAFILFIPIDVDANDEVFFNKYGVVLNLNEVEYLDKMFYDTYKDNITFADYNLLFANGLPDVNQIESNVYVQYNKLRDVSYSTANKKITLNKVPAGNIYNVSIIVEWLNNPNVRSYDVIGARFTSSANARNIVTKLESSSRSKRFTDLVNNTSGVGCSVLLNSSDSNIRISQSFSITNNTRVTASYQHARSEVSLSDSMNYGFSASGLGGVFAFNNGISSKYDGMLGVYLD